MNKSGKSVVRCILLATAVVALLRAPAVSGAQSSNTAYGWNDLVFDTTGYNNSAFGFGALLDNTTGFNNTAAGYGALLINTAGFDNAAFGYGALYYNTTANYNTAAGSNSLHLNTTGFDNTANGYAALYTNTTGSYNAATGFKSLFSNTTGYDNAANGVGALYSNNTGYLNTANGGYALYANTAGYNNSATGYVALYDNTTGNNNTATGIGALSSNTTGSGNIALGSYAGEYITTGSHNISIGSGGANETGVIRIGTANTHKAAYIAGITGVTASGGVSVFINSNGKLGTLTSSRRFKNDIKDMGSITDKLMQLRPVTFRYKKLCRERRSSPSVRAHRGRGGRVFTDLVQFDQHGKPFTVYYHLLAPMVLNQLPQKKPAADRIWRSRTEITALKFTVKTEVTKLQAASQGRNRGTEIGSPGRN